MKKNQRKGTVRRKVVRFETPVEDEAGQWELIPEEKGSSVHKGRSIGKLSQVVFPESYGFDYIG